MGWVWWFIAVPLGVAALWAIFAPRNQWRSLFSWSVANAHTAEPGGAAYASRQILAALALGSALTMIVIAMVATMVNEPQESSSPSDIQNMWGSPAPLLVYRTFQTAKSVDDSLVDVPIESYLSVNDDEYPPLYLLELEPFSRLGTTGIPGYIGSEPAETDSTITRADVVIHVRGPLLCIPRRVVAVETPDVVQLAVQYGLPTPSDGSKPDNVEACPVGEDLSGSVLIPVRLKDPIGERSVQSLDGTPLAMADSEG
ncbi:fumarate hydratase [Salinibacterium sp. UTAS2018]|uniref:fumarate hydratase n=1 Tax=Salinibacterium sp. UTAS2018 TaxID=2508880 RepID=UPI0010094181|nr:fumarate hydratase [Salinibacterium sp. UTAS2018]QAV71324.1 fumarate hydratase [Salinibacterium sp. UTAS2018]